MPEDNSAESALPKSDRKAPGFWFYTADYERDVQILSLAGQGLWSRMLCWMNDNEAHRGFAELPSGEPMSGRDIAVKVGKSIREVNKVLNELEHVGVFSIDDRGCYFCRRMAREKSISESRRAAAKSRWDKAKGAAVGDFASDFAYAKVPCKPPCKTMQTPSVTASASASVPDSALLRRRRSNGAHAKSADFPKTDAAVRRRCPTADLTIVTQIVQAAFQSYFSVDNPKCAEPTDEDLAEAVDEAAAGARKQSSAGLFLTTVPNVVKTWAEFGRDSANDYRELKSVKD